jgi:hypothetical protein
MRLVLEVVFFYAELSARRLLLCGTRPMQSVFVSTSLHEVVLL